MKKEYCNSCVCLTDVAGVWICDDMALPISKFYECPNDNNQKEKELENVNSI